MQLNELGVLETPIALTNTFAVGTVATAQIRAAIAAQSRASRGRRRRSTRWCSSAATRGCPTCRRIGRHRGATTTPALAAATPSSSAARSARAAGMSCFGLKGGIGTASRRLDSDRPHRHDRRAGAREFRQARKPAIAGRRIGPALAARLEGSAPQRDQGSVIVVLATDAPLDHRQLRRVATRGAAGIARTGSYYGHGSGDIVVAFSTAERVPHVAVGTVLTRRMPRRVRARAAVPRRRRRHRAGDPRRAVLGHHRHRASPATPAVALTDVAPDWATLG